MVVWSYTTRMLLTGIVATRRSPSRLSRSVGPSAIGCRGVVSMTIGLAGVATISADGVLVTRTDSAVMVGSRCAVAVGVGSFVAVNTTVVAVFGTIMAVAE